MSKKFDTFLHKNKSNSNTTNHPYSTPENIENLFENSFL